jgi:hypothetical protein
MACLAVPMRGAASRKCDSSTATVTRSCRRGTKGSSSSRAGAAAVVAQHSRALAGLEGECRGRQVGAVGCRTCRDPGDVRLGERRLVFDPPRHRRRARAGCAGDARGLHGLRAADALLPGDDALDADAGLDLPDDLAAWGYPNHGQLANFVPENEYHLDDVLTEHLADANFDPGLLKALCGPPNCSCPLSESHRIRVNNQLANRRWAGSPARLFGGLGRAAGDRFDKFSVLAP